MANLDAGSLPPAAAATDRGRRLRTLVRPATGQEGLGGSALLSAQFWVDASLWRPAGFWGVVAGVLVTGGLGPAGALDAKTILLLVLLADILWGAIWRLAGGRDELLALPGKAAGGRVWMPYLQADSPAARLLGGDNTDIWPLAVRTGLPVFLLALLVAFVLGWPAMALTVVVAVVAGLAWTVRRTFGITPALLLSLAATGLPWALTVVTLAPALDQAQWLAPFLFAGLWTIHQWGSIRVSADVQDKLGLVLMAAAEVAVCGLLIILQAPLWLALVVVLCLPTWLLVFRQQSPARVQVLWLAAMLVSASALGQIS